LHGSPFSDIYLYDGFKIHLNVGPRSQKAYIKIGSSGLIFRRLGQPNSPFFLSRQSSEFVRSFGLAMGKAWLEGFKFSVYLAVPVALTAAFAVNPENLEAVIRNVRAR
jgi:hypothetical protein